MTIDLTDVPADLRSAVTAALDAAGVEDGHLAVEIVDEAQNTSPEQIKMFLTRLGFNSKMVVTGDVTQTDLPRDQRSGLLVIEDILSDVEGIEFVRFGGEVVVRHKLVQRIVAAYNEHAEKQAPPLREARRRGQA